MTCGKIDLGCTKCRLSKKRTLVVAGNGPCSSDLVFVGEAPGRDEDVTGKPFVGSAGKLLNAALEAAGVRRDTVFCTNIVKCRPPNNRKPRKDEIRTCAGLYLTSELETIEPKVICALGQTAAEYFIDLDERLSDVIGCEMSVAFLGEQVKFFVSYHPAAVLYQRKKMNDFQRGIASAVKAAGLG
jgi:uracil-DNA glycosylase family 4